MTADVTPIRGDWPHPTDDPEFYRPPELGDFRDDRDGLERLTLACAGYWSTPDTTAAMLDLAPDCFRRGAHRMLFEAMLALHLDREDITVASVAERLGDRLEDAGGMRLLLAVFPPHFPGGSLSTYARLLAEWARRERMMEIVKRLPADVKADTLDPDQVAEEMARHMPSGEYGIDRVDDVWEDTVDRIVGAVDSGVEVGWPRLAAHYRVAAGLWTVVTGIAGSGKSTLVDNVAVGLAERHGWRFAMFSPESAPTSRHVKRLLRMHLGRDPAAFSGERLDEAKAFIRDHFEWVRSTDGVTLEEILRRADVIHRRRPVNGLVIDPWNEIDRGRGDRESEHLRISQGLSDIRRWARKRAVHAWVVAHPVKLERTSQGYRTPTLYDVSGSGTWRDKADMGVVVERDFADWRAPTKIHVTKVRFADHGSLGVVPMAFDRESETFREHVGGVM